MSESSLNLAALPDLCNAGPRLLTLTGFFRAWLTLHFSSSQSICLPDWKKRLWTPDPATTQIVIEDAFAYNPGRIGQRPGLLIRRNSFKGIRLGIDSGRDMGGRSTTGEQFYTNAWQGSYTIFCLARLPGEVDQLAYEAWFTLNSYAPAVRKSFALNAISVAEIGAQGILKESAGQQWAVPITIALVMQENWVLRPDSPPIRGMDTSIDL